MLSIREKGKEKKWEREDLIDSVSLVCQAGHKE